MSNEGISEEWAICYKSFSLVQVKNYYYGHKIKLVMIY